MDAHVNFAVSAVAVAPAPALSGVTLTVAAGEGARFPAVPFNATIAPIAGLPTPANAEIVRVTARTNDVLTIVRTQEGTAARAVQVGDLIAATITAKTITDIEGLLAFPATQVPSANPNTLDDYEEGNWTPSLGGTTSQSGQTATVQGQYIKIGQFVWASFEIYMTALGTITGSVVINGLPFPANSAMVSGFFTNSFGFYAMATNWITISGQVNNGTSFVTLYGQAALSATNLNLLSQTDFTSASILRGTVVYRAAQ